MWPSDFVAAPRGPSLRQGGRRVCWGGGRLSPQCAYPPRAGCRQRRAGWRPAPLRGKVPFKGAKSEDSWNDPGSAKSVRAYVHTYTRTYIRTYIRTNVHTHIRTYAHTHIRTCRDGEPFRRGLWAGQASEVYASGISAGGGPGRGGRLSSPCAPMT